MRQKKRRQRIIGSIFIVVLLVLAYFSLGPGIGTHSKQRTVVVGVVSQTKQDAAIWQAVAQTASQKYGIHLIIKNFSDYNQPNKALKNGDIDLNAFQHYAFLHAWNKANGGGITALGQTYVAPIKIYSQKYRHLSQLPANSLVAVPNDASNESRALYVLKSAGLIKLKRQQLATIADITQNPKHLKIKEVSAEQSSRILDSAACAVVNNNYATAAGLSEKEVIYTEPLTRETRQWINIIAVRKTDRHNRNYQDILKSYQTNHVKRLMKHYYGKTQLPAWDLKMR